jgi:formiminoglutamase
MKDISIYFKPVEKELTANEGTIGAAIQMHSSHGFPDLKKGGVALIYVPEFRNGKKKFHQKANDDFRNSLYELYVGMNWEFELYDCGTIFPGETVEDTYFALSQVIAELVKEEILPIIVGGTQDLLYAVYKGYGELEQMVNVCSVDHRLDLGNPEKKIHKDGFLSHLLLHRPCYLFNHANIGCQAPFINTEELDLFDKLYFDICRLGEFVSDFKKAEPHIRNADLFNIDVESIRSSDCSGEYYTSPNGFYAEQICQIAKYAGISDKLTSFALYNVYPEGNNPSFPNLIAQIIWYFMDGLAQRKGDFPIGSKSDYTKFRVNLNDFKEELVFYKSNKSARWWLEVPYPPSGASKYSRHHMVPCDYADYELAMKNEVPNLWWKTYQKLC